MLSIIIPVYFEDKNIVFVLEEIRKKVRVNHEILIVYDIDNDPTIPTVKKYQAKNKKNKIILVKNFIGTKRGVLNAIKSGIKRAVGQAIVIVMADLSDDIKIIDLMFEKIKKGDDIVCGSRYMTGGKQIGGPVLKGALSRLAGLSFYHLFGFPTHDPTNAFKMYKKSIFDKIKIESDGGFEYSIEIVVKAFKKGYKIAEIPSIWRDRVAGQSKFNLVKWLPKYIRWYLYLFKNNGT